MLILGIDTATPWGSLALTEDEETIAEISIRVNKGGGESLLAMVETIFAKTGRRLDQVELIAAGVGPGSYTGIRVGLAAVKGLAAGLEIPAYGINTLRIIAENARYAAKWIAVCLDARRGNIYSALYQNKDDRLIEVDAPGIIPLPEFTAKFASLTDGIVCGDAGKLYPEVWENHPSFRIAPRNWDRPSAAHAAQIVYQEVKQSTGACDPELLPAYLRRVEAEIRFEESMHGNQHRSDVCGRH